STEEILSRFHDAQRHHGKRKGNENCCQRVLHFVARGSASYGNAGEHPRSQLVLYAGSNGRHEISAVEKKMAGARPISAGYGCSRQSFNAPTVWRLQGSCVPAG